MLVCMCTCVFVCVCVYVFAVCVYACTDINAHTFTRTQIITYATASEVAAVITALADVISNAAATARAISECRICNNSSHGAKQNAVWS